MISGKNLKKSRSCDLDYSIEECLGFLDGKMGLCSETSHPDVVFWYGPSWKMLGGSGILKFLEHFLRKIYISNFKDVEMEG